MRITVLTHMPHLVTLGGANRVLRRTAESLAARGHDVRVITPLLGEPPGATKPRDIRAALGPTVFADLEGRANGRVDIAGVKVTTVDCASFFERAWQLLCSDPPDVVVVPTEDPSQRPLATALQGSVPVVALSQTPGTLGFGPGALERSDRTDAPALEALRSADLVVANSQFLTDYLIAHGELDAVHVPLPGASIPVQSVQTTGTKSVLLINPSKIKGIDIFVSLAQRERDVDFAAVPTWSTTTDDIASLRSLPNVRVVEPNLDIHTILADASVLLVPSLWTENVPLVITESMLAGVPVVASRIGGVPEVARGGAVLVDVEPITEYTPSKGSSVPSAVVPSQDLRPWQQAVKRLLSDPDFRLGRIAAGRRAALETIALQDVSVLERTLSLVATPTSDD